MPISDNFKSIHEKEFHIEFTFCAPDGSLRLTALCDILQITASEHADQGGISFSDMQEFHQAWVMSRMRLEIADLPKWKDTVTVKTWIVGLENSRSVRAMEVYKDGKKIAGCETYWAVFNTETRRPQALALPHEHFEKFADRLPTHQSTSKIDLPKEMIFLTDHRVKYSDLDIVNHANHVKYLEWCLDTFEDYGNMDKIQSLDMNFASELSYNDQVEIRGNQSSNPDRFGIYRSGRLCFALQLGR